MNPLGLPSLSDALAAVESTQTAIGTADTALANANTKLAAAQATQTQATTDDGDAIVAGNNAIDVAIQVLTATKR